MAAIQTMKRSDTQKEPAALIFSNTAGSKIGAKNHLLKPTVFSFPVGRGRLLSYIEIKKEPITTSEFTLCIIGSASVRLALG